MKADIEQIHENDGALPTAKPRDEAFTTNVSSVDLSNATQNAKWFKSITGYCDYYWQKT